jgi:hypothetical protein
MSNAQDNLFDDDEDDDDVTSNPENDKRLSAQLHKKEKEADALAKKLEKLEADMKVVVEEKRTSVVSAAAKELGIKDKHIGFYTGEPDVEAIRSWAVDNEFIEAKGEEQESAGEDKGQSFAPGGFGSADGDDVAGRTGKITLEEAVKIYQENPERYVKLAAAGRVEHIDPSRTGVGQSMADVDMDFDEQYFSVPRDG